MTNQVAQQQKPTKLTDLVLDRVKQMQDTQDLSLPKNYNASNALNAAFLELQKAQDRNHRPALEVCSRDSIVKSLLDMTLQGLSPAKDQCYFIVYGNELQMKRSYFGSITAVKRLDIVKDVKSYVIHDGDEFEIDTNDQMEVVVSKFHPKFSNQDNPIVGAYAIIFLNDGSKDFTVMTKKEIDQSWAQTRQKNNKVQQNFSQEMAKRTVLNRAAKMFINTSDDSDLLTGAINDTTSNEYDDERRDVTPVEDEKQSTDELLEGFQKSQEAKAKGVSNNGNSNENKEEASEEVADGQTELFNEGTIKPADEADS